MCADKLTGAIASLICLSEPKRSNVTRVMAALPNIGGALCLTPQSLADAHSYSGRQPNFGQAERLET